MKLCRYCRWCRPMWGALAIAPFWLFPGIALAAIGADIEIGRATP
jgi:hypothetical protein